MDVEGNDELGSYTLWRCPRSRWLRVRRQGCLVCLQLGREVSSPCIPAQSAAGPLGGDTGAHLPPDQNKEPLVTEADHRATSQRGAPWEEL